MIGGLDAKYGCVHAKYSPWELCKFAAFAEVEAVSHLAIFGVAFKYADKLGHLLWCVDDKLVCVVS